MASEIRFALAVLQKIKHILLGGDGIQHGNLTALRKKNVVKGIIRIFSQLLRNSRNGLAA